MGSPIAKLAHEIGVLLDGVETLLNRTVQRRLLVRHPLAIGNDEPQFQLQSTRFDEPVQCREVGHGASALVASDRRLRCPCPQSELHLGEAGPRAGLANQGPNRPGRRGVAHVDNYTCYNIDLDRYIKSPADRSSVQSRGDGD